MTLPKSSNINNYGSGVMKDEIPLVDPTTEWGADSINPLRNDVAASTNVVPRLLLQFTGTASSPVVATTATWTAGNDSVWGNSLSTLPTISRSSTGVFVITTPTSVADQIGNTNLVNIRAAECSVMSGTTPAFTVCVVNSSNSITVQLFDITGSPTDLVGSLLFVKAF